ncbi:hypothetical protein G9464_14010 [Halostella sp. JP-L12]|uniref:hypothetical protein n=1 Tax=Halostella TaxID=1843185 RepID=UPI000EF81CE1|nr:MULTISPECIES: hypothetical protein [Halostella]NHN48700.1 hypothetical protein [Halostella sp. JP-L12]
MPDLLSHVLLAYAGMTAASWVVDPLTDEWVAVGAAGAAIPDLVKVEMVIGSGTVGSLLGVPFDFGAIGTLGGVLLVAGVIALCFGSHRRRAYACLVAGGFTGLFFDGLRAYAGGRAGFWLYPVTWRPPTPSLYVSSDPRVLGAAIVVAALVFVLDRLALDRLALDL